MKEENKSDETVCSAAPDGRGKDEPSVPPDHAEHAMQTFEAFVEHIVPLWGKDLLSTKEGLWVTWSIGYAVGLNRGIETAAASTGC